MSRGVRARIDCSALTHNLRRARESAPDSRVMAVIKADGYGHGLLDAARSLAEADAFAVEDAEDAVELREAGIDRPITLLSGFHDAVDLAPISEWRLSPVIHDHWQITALRRGPRSAAMDVWVKVDSGMHRLGFDPADLPEVVQIVESLPDVRIAGFMSHLARADDLANPTTPRQCEVFREATSAWTYPRSLANSPGVLGWPVTHLDWVRPGMMLYGCSPVQDRTEAQLALRPAMTLESQIIAIKSVAAGENIGYGGTWHCDTATRAGVLACGYGDGYPRHAPSGTPVWVSGSPSRILGRVSMDLITIDLSQCEHARVGDWAELWGAHVPASDVAARAGTIPYELVTRVSARVPRIHET